MGVLFSSSPRSRPSVRWNCTGQAPTVLALASRRSSRLNDPGRPPARTHALDSNSPTSIGARVPRREDPALLTGNGRFIDDIARTHQAHAWIVRSPHAHARIASIDTQVAATARGVIAVFTHHDLESDGVAPLSEPNTVVGRDGEPTVDVPHPLLARDRVMHVGEPVAMVVANSRSVAQEAAEQVVVEFEELDMVIDGRAALDASAPCLWPSAPGNLALDWEGGDADATDAAFERADHVTRLDITNNRIVIAPMETRGVIAEYEPRDGRYTIWTPSQGVGSLLAPLARSLGVLESRIRVITNDVGRCIRHQDFTIPGARSRSLGGTAPRQARKVDRGALGELSLRRPGTRPRDRGRTGARRRGTVPGCPRTHGVEHGRLFDVRGADHPDGGRHPLPHRRVPNSRMARTDSRSVHQHGAGPGVPRRGKARIQPRDRAPRGCRGTRDRSRSGRASTSERRPPPMRCPTPPAPGSSSTAASSRPTWTTHSHWPTDRDSRRGAWRRAPAACLEAWASRSSRNRTATSTIGSRSCFIPRESFR